MSDTIHAARDENGVTHAITVRTPVAPVSFPPRWRATTHCGRTLHNVHISEHATNGIRCPDCHDALQPTPTTTTSAPLQLRT